MPPKQYENSPSLILDPTMKYSATIETNQGTMTVELFPAEVPITVNNFVFLAREGFYEDGCFHRIISGFMIQGGCPDGNGRGGPGYRFQDEEVTRPYTKGTLAMANSGPNTNGSQFFIMHGDNDRMPPNYTVFGKLTEGEETLDKIAGSPTIPGGENSKPAERLPIHNVTIHEEPINP